MPKKEVSTISYHLVHVKETTLGRLHATTPINLASQEYMLKRTPSEAQLAARREAGEPIIPIEDLAEGVRGETTPAAEEGKIQMAVWRRDKNGHPYVHSNFIKGHLRDAAGTTGRAVNFWDLKGFLTGTLFVTPYRIYLPEGTAIGEDEWPTHFEIYRMGRVSAFRRAEYAESPTLTYDLIILADPRWKRGLLLAIYTQGSIMGKGGSRRLESGKYTFEIGDFVPCSAEEALEMIRAGVMEEAQAARE